MSAEERDTVVADALATITVPDHGPEFWTRLEDAMGEREAPAPRVVVPPTSATSVFAEDHAEPEVTVAPAREVVLDDHEGAAGTAGRRWGIGVARVLVAAAVVGVVAIAGVLVARRDDTGPDLSDQTTASTVPGDTATSEAPATTTPTADAPEAQTVIAFVDALARGDVDAAAAMLGPRSEEYVSALSGSAEAFLTDSGESIGAWSTASDRTITVARDMGGATVVVLAGTLPSDDGPAYQRFAVPVVTSGSMPDVSFVDPWAFDPEVEDQRIQFLQPQPSEQGVTLSPGGTVEVGFAQPGTAYFSLDGAPGTEVATTDGLVGHIADWTVPEDAADGATAVIAFQSESGKTFIAQAVPVSAG